MLLGGTDDDARLMAAAEEGAAAAVRAAAPGGWWSLEEAAVQLGASEPALKLFVSIILGYPFAFFHRWFLRGRGPHLVHYYNSVLGLWMAYFNFGWHMLHSLACVVVQFLILRLMGRTVTCVVSTFLFQMAYLSAGYYFTATEQYDIKWTMPHCVLTLKLIGLALDYYDGRKDKSSLSQEQQQHALRECPGLLEMTGFAYFYGAFLVGPQFSLSRYLRSVTPPPEGERPSSLLPAVRRLCLGMVYVALFTVAKPFYPDEYLLTDAFAGRSLGYKCLYIALWGKVSLTKYVSCWLVAEGVCILTELSYNGEDESGRPLWDGCTNIRVWLFESTPYFRGTIAGFNIQTNLWASRCIFKRLKFLGNKLLSQVLTLLFLSVWHGMHSGYFMCFFMEFLIVYHEDQMLKLAAESALLSRLTASAKLRPLVYVAMQAFHWLFMGYSLLPFCLLSWEKWVPVYQSVYFLGHVVFLGNLLLLPLHRKLLRPSKQHKAD